MPLRKTGDADAEAALVRMHAAVVEAPDEGHEFRGVFEGIAAAVVVRSVARRIAAQRQDIAHIRAGHNARRISAISASLWHTQVKCGTGSSDVWFLMRITRSCVTSRVVPPAP